MVAVEARRWAFHEVARRAAGRLVTTLASEDVPVLLFKGIVLAREVYSDVALRPITDVDALVRPRDFFRVVAIARKQGWRRLWDSKSLGIVNVMVDGVACDLSAFVGPAGTSSLSVGDLLARSTVGEGCLGFPHLQIDPHDHALLMAIDVFKDKFANAKVKAREDLVRLTDSSSFDGRRLVARATEARLRTMLWIVAGWVLEGGASAVWKQVHAELDAGIRRHAYARRYRELARQPFGSGYPWRAGLVARQVSDSSWHRLASVALGALGLAAYLATGRRLRDH